MLVCFYCGCFNGGTNDRFLSSRNVLLLCSSYALSNSSVIKSFNLGDIQRVFSTIVVKNVHVLVVNATNYRALM